MVRLSDYRIQEALERVGGPTLHSVDSSRMAPRNTVLWRQAHQRALHPTDETATDATPVTRSQTVLGRHHNGHHTRTLLSGDAVLSARGKAWHTPETVEHRTCPTNA